MSYASAALKTSRVSFSSSVWDGDHWYWKDWKHFENLRHPWELLDDICPISLELCTKWFKRLIAFEQMDNKAVEVLEENCSMPTADGVQNPKLKSSAKELCNDGVEFAKEHETTG